MSLTKVLVFLDCARQEGRDFLEDQGASLHEVEEKDEDNNGEEGEGYEDDDNLPEDTPKDDAEEGEDNDEDMQVIESEPAPSKCWTRSQQA